jgi:SAM-dependent methyltransferase
MVRLVANARCPLCLEPPTDEPVAAREMMFGLRETFVYRQCSGCRSLWLEEVPDNMERFYQRGYYSLQGSALREVRLRTVKKAAIRILLQLPPTLVEQRLVAQKRVPRFVAWLARSGARPSSTIADVGCGDGGLIRQMARYGFSELWGFDPYLPGNTDEGDVHLRAVGVPDITGTFDVIMLHHSFEHMDDPFQVLMMLRDRLTRNGTILIRLPVTGTFAWRTYGTDWVALDPPRHLFVPTIAGMHAVAARAGYAIDRVFFDSYALQFWGSEKYKHDIPLGSAEKIFSETQIAAWEKRSKELNAKSDGDSAGFLMRPA